MHIPFIMRILFMFFILLSLSSCGFSSDQTASDILELEKPQPIIATLEAETIAEEPLVYSSNSSAPAVELAFGGAPLKLPNSGFVRLVGILGSSIILEIEGQSQSFKQGDKLGVYVLSKIFKDKVLLEKAGSSAIDRAPAN